jgi:large subunit ribosomal protein L18
MAKNRIVERNKARERRAQRTRAKIFGTAQAPRLSVFCSNRSSYAQLIDDEKGVTLVSASTYELSLEDRKKTKVEQAKMLGELLAKKAREIGITKAIFDRGSYKYHGRVAAIAEGARNGGISI